MAFGPYQKSPPWSEWKGTGHNSENDEGDIQAPNCQSHSLDAQIVIETVWFGRWYVGTRKKNGEREQSFKYGRSRLIRSKCPMVRNYSVKELSHRATWAVFKQHLLSSQFSSVQFSSAQFEEQTTTGLSLSLSMTTMVVATSRVYESSCGHLGRIKHPLDKGRADPKSL